MSKTDKQKEIILWYQVLNEITPLSTQTILRSKMCSIDFDWKNSTVAVEVVSPAFSKFIRENYLDKLQTAFTLVLKKSVVVRIFSDEEDREKEKEEVSLQKIADLEEKNRQNFSQFDSVTVTEESERRNNNNQGLGAPYQWNGLNFRSKSEMKIAQALDEQGVLYFPNARGRLSLNYNRVNREADFLICHEGRWGILECDGEAYHQSAATDHSRDMVWNANGIWFIKRFPSEECYENPNKVVSLFLEMLKLFYDQNKKY